MCDLRSLLNVLSESAEPARTHSGATRCHVHLARKGDAAQDDDAERRTNQQWIMPGGGDFVSKVVRRRVSEASAAKLEDRVIHPAAPAVPMRLHNPN